MAKQIQINSELSVEELLKQSELLIKKSDVNNEHIKEQLKRMKKKSKEVERRISLLL
ncbi:MAG: hypothetical protein AABX73_03310 [Nanoarchaeota archaeon]